MKLVSYIVPVYNAELYIEKCVKSILAQSYLQKEIILIDDGSKDRSLEIIKKLEEEYDQVQAYTQNNKGASSTRNRGIELAKGDYIQFVDADDTIAPTMTSDLVKKLEEDELDLVICDFEISGNSLLLNIPAFSLSLDKAFVQYYEELMKNVLLQGPCNKIYKAEIIRENRIIFPSEYKKLEDSIFNAKYLCYSKRIGYIPSKLYHYYVENPNSLTKSVYLNEVKALCEFNKILLSNAFSNQANKSIMHYFGFQIEMIYRLSWLRSKMRGLNYKTVFDQFSKDLLSEGKIFICNDNFSYFSLRSKVLISFIKYKQYYLTVFYFMFIEFVKRLKRSL